MTTPAAVAAIANGREARLVWDNEVGGLTYAVGDVFIKWIASTTHLDLDRERHRLAWAGRYTAVPGVIDHGRDNDGSWLVTRALPGDNYGPGRESAVLDACPRRRSHALLPPALGSRTLI